MYHHLSFAVDNQQSEGCRSSARQEKRMAAMRECAKMMTTSAGGCTTPFPFEAAIWLLEEQEELFGGTFPVQNVEVGLARFKYLKIMWCVPTRVVQLTRLTKFHRVKASQTPPE